MRGGHHLCTTIAVIRGHYVIYGGLRASLIYFKFDFVFRGTHERKQKSTPTCEGSTGSRAGGISLLKANDAYDRGMYLILA